MNRERLENYKDLECEIKHLEKRLKKLKDDNIETDFVTGSERELPYRVMTYKVQGIKSNHELIRRTEQILKKRKLKAMREKVEIEEWISNLFDTRMRLIFDMRYIENKTWLEISRKLGSNNPDYARVTHMRYLEKMGCSNEKD